MTEVNFFSCNSYFFMSKGVLCIDRRNEELSCYPVGIEDLCFKLRNDCDSLLAISRKLSLIAVQMKRILEATTNG